MEIEITEIKQNQRSNILTTQRFLFRLITQYRKHVIGPGS